jgi:predicted P-loop ATPase
MMTSAVDVIQGVPAEANSQPGGVSGRGEDIQLNQTEVEIEAAVSRRYNAEDLAHTERLQYLCPAVSPARALSLGWSIIPVGLDKKPLVSRWKPYQKRQPTEDELRAWTRSNPSAWALVTGIISGRITLDFDGEPGCRVLEQLDLPPHRRTPSGGYHVDFRHPGWPVPTLNSKTKKELGARWPGLDIRADGGYVVFAGRNRRGEYCWLRDVDAEDVDILPRDLRAFLGLLHPQVREAKTVTTNVSFVGRVDASRLIAAALDRARSEGRNNVGFWLATQLRDNGYHQNEAEGVMPEYVGRVPETNTKGHREPYTLAEALASVRQAFSVPAREPWEKPILMLRSKSTEQRTGTERPRIEPASNWRDELIQIQDGKPKGVLANAITAFRKAPEWVGVLAFNEFSNAVVTVNPAPWKGTGVEWTDQEDRLAANWLQHAGILVSVEVAGQAVQTVARDHRVHPVRKYLDGLLWDGTKRIDTWLSEYLGASLNPYVEAVGACWLISAMARVFEPGCKADCCLILEGEQGIRKSTALKTLAGEWFTDELAELGSKDASLQTRGIWIIEIAELGSLTRADVGKIKSFMSRTTDRFRPPYSKRLIESKRQCIFAGSVNHSTYLRDETGSRRFWPVRCGEIRIKELARDRDQLWAEAVARYRAGSVWWLNSVELNRAAEQEQAARYEGDPWDELITDWITHPKQRVDEVGQPIKPFTSMSGSVTVSDILLHCIGKCQEQWTQTDKTRVARCLRSIGWERYRDRQLDMGWRYRPRTCSQCSQ